MSTVELERIFQPKPQRFAYPNWLYDYFFYDYQSDYYPLLEDWECVIRPRLNCLPNAIIMDLMANKMIIQNVADGLHVPVSGLAVEYEPQHSSYWEYGSRYKQNDIKLLNADLQKSTTFYAINQWLAGRKAHIIMERGNGGIKCISNRRMYYKAVVSRLWSMMDSDWSMLLLQTPPEEVLWQKGIDMPTWIQRVDEAGFPVKWKPDGGSSCMQKLGYSFGFLRIEKTADKPLPPLP